MANYIFLLLIVFITPTAYALDSITLKLEQLTLQKWQLNGVEIKLKALKKQKQQLVLSIKKMRLPKPFDDLKLVDIRCQQFTWGNNAIHCQQGKASLKSKRFRSPQFNFSFLISEPKAEFTLSQLKLLGGRFDLHATAKLDKWDVSLQAKKVALNLLQPFLSSHLKLSKGSVSFNLKAKGIGNQSRKLKAKVAINQLSLQTKDGKKATEAFTLVTTVDLNQQQTNWFWQQHSIFKSGNIYIEPLYLENKNTKISLKSQGVFNTTNQQIAINQLNFTHPDVGFIESYAKIKLKPKFELELVDAHAQIESLQQFSVIYLNSITETTSLEGLSLEGNVDATIKIKDNQPDNGYLIANYLQLNDLKKRFNLKDGAMILKWSKDENFKEDSMVSWRQLDLFSIPFSRTYFTLLLKNKQISLLKAFDVPLLGGKIKIKTFDWKAVEDKSPKVVFSGAIEAISLEELTKALAVKSLSGDISGDIPGVQFEAGKLNLDGGLQINLFEGEINIKELMLSGLGSDFSQFNSTIEIKNLDLELMTDKFEFGGMKGRLSGGIRDLKMENWKPITFYAWLGTEDDGSKHQISQKAVENIASIGGGGAVDFVSRMILGLFDNFDYEQMGLGCYLNNGICQLMGVEAAGERGYYIVKGGGLPRIDVMGYETQVDWDELWKRLSRISQSDNIVVEDPTLE
ncbi:MAG: DUF748 domain-containing protein [Methylococcales bacterium]|nr:DUF748 domain-containing protein [Methylococcales bacterium]